jgi:hypothetical protein
MKFPDRDLLWDLLAGSAAVLAFVGSIELGRLYHGNYGLSFDDFVPLSYLLVSWLSFGVLWWRHSRRIFVLGRIWMWLSLLVGLAVRFGALSMQIWGSALTALMIGFLLCIGIWISCKASAWVWAGLRRVIAFVPALFVIAPMVAGYGMDGPVVWLEGSTSRQSTSNATVVLLLDELNATSSAGLQKVLTDRGLQVNYKPVLPVHGSTNEVVPAVFTGLDFKGARACGLARVCANSHALDFAQVSVQRDDVDVVGFHHPYCAIQGLRSCLRLSTSRSIWEDGRWDCALQRRFGIKKDRDEKECQLLAHVAWHDMRGKVIDGLMNAPTLERGGVVFAHVPLPHPPAAGTGTLADQYTTNLKQSEEMLAAILDRLAANKIEPRVMIFSDHPLRPAMWCTNSAAQFDAPCVVTPDLVDDHVPLIVAVRSNVPSIAHVQSNQQVFDVLRDWLRH